MLLAKEGMALQGMIVRLVEIVRCYRTEMNVENPHNENLKGVIPLQIMVDQKQLENVKYFNYVGSVITNDASCTREIKSGWPWQKQRPIGRKVF